MVDSGVPRHVLAAGLVLWGLVFVLAGVLLLPMLASTITGVATAGDAGDDGAAARENAANASSVTVRQSENVSLSVDDGSGIDLVVDLGSFQTAVETDGGDTDRATVSMRSEAIDEGVERDGTAGLCVVGFDSADAPVTIDLDSDEGAVNATVNASPSTDDGNVGSDPESIVAACRTR